MNLRRITFPVFVCLLAVAVAASGQNVFVTPRPDAASLVVAGYSETLQFFSSISPASPPVFQVLPTPGGERIFLISSNTTGPVQIANVVGGQYVAGAVLSLDGLKPVAAAMSPNGQRLVVLTTAENNAGTLFVLDASTAAVIPGGRVSVGFNPSSVVISPTSSHAFVLTGAQMTAVDLASGQTTVINLPAAATRLSLSPTGSIYVSARYLITEYDVRPPFTELGRIRTLADPSTISFTPDGRYGVAVNTFGYGSSIELYDFNLKSADPDSSAGAPIRRVPILDETGFSLIVPDQVIVVSATRAVGLAGAKDKLYTIELPSLAVREIFLGSAAGPPPYVAIAASDEHPASRSLYVLNTQGVVSRFDLLENTTGQSAVTGAAGNVHYRTRASLGAPAAISAVNLNQVVGPDKLLRPYLVKVVDALGKPIFGQTVTFTAAGGVGVNPTSTATNVDGVALVQVTSPLSSGPFTVRATAGTLTLDMTSTVLGGGGGGGGGSLRLVKVSGDGTLMGVGGGARTLTLRVVNEQGDPLPNAQVTWARSEGIALSVDFNPITNTDEKGETSVFVFPPTYLSSTLPFASFQVTAATSFGSTSFRILVYPATGGDYSTRPVTQLIKPALPPYTFNLKLGQVMREAIQVGIFAQGGAVSGVPYPDVAINAYTVIGYDVLGQPIFNLDKTKGPVTRCDGINNSDAQGTATCNLVAEGKPGTLPLLIDIGNGERAYTGTVFVTPGDPIAPQLVGGNAQTAKVGETLPLLLQARTTDAFGNILTGVAVTWEVVTPGSVTLLDTVSTSNAQGIVSTRVRLGNTPGSFQVRARIGDNILTFNMTALPVATAIIKVSGDPQPEGFVNEPFAQPLVVQARDVNGMPVANVLVAWAVTGGSATISAAQTTTDSNGRAQVTVTAGATPGPIVITATSAGLGSVSFSLQTRLRGPSITAASFRNLASGETGIAPGNLVIISGRGMAPGVQGTIYPNLSLGRLPYELNSTTVVFRSGGVDHAAPFWQVTNDLGEEYVVVQVPFEIGLDPVECRVVAKGAEAIVTGIPVRPVSPGILEENYPNARRAAIVIRSDGLVVTPETPARRGETVRMYAIGLGQTTPEAATNRPGIADQRVNAVVAVGVDDKGVQVLSARMADNLIGIYEIVFVVPADATIGANRPLGLVIEATPGQPAYAQGSIIAVGAN
jgi:uncharacterized protein (TIGR03437 family)